MSDQRLEEIKNQNNKYPIVIIVKGEKNEGKTKFIKELITSLKHKKIDIGGIISEKVIENEIITGYDIVNINNSEKMIFLRKGDFKGCNKIRKFSIFKEGISFGNNTITNTLENNQVIIIDEVGQLELDNKGWNDAITDILSGSTKILIISVRSEFTDSIISKYRLTNHTIYDISEHSNKDIINKINNILI